MKKALPLFLFSLLFVMFSCKEDDFEHLPGDTGHELKQKISFSDLQRKLSSRNLERHYSFIDPVSRGIEEFEIDTTEIVMIRTASSTTYSMKAVPLAGEDGNLYNLYLYDKHGDVSEQIVKYKEGVENPFSDENTEIIYSNRGTCLAIIVAPCEYGNWHDDEHCEADGWVVIYLGDCSDGGGGGDSDDNGPGSGDSDDPVTPVGHEPGDGSGGGGGSGYNAPACTSLKNKLNEPLQNGQNFKTRLQELRPLVNNSPNEHGFVNQNPNEADVPFPPSQTNQYNPTYSTNPHDTHSPFLDQVQTFGYMHTHRNAEDVAGIHSMMDIKTFVDIVRRRAKAGLPTDNTYGIVVGSHGIYAMKVDNIDDFMSGYGAIPNRFVNAEFWEKFRKDYEDYVENRTFDQNNQADNEKALLRLLKIYQFDLGIGVYRATENLSGWNKIELNANGQVHSAYCN